MLGSVGTNMPAAVTVTSMGMPPQRCPIMHAALKNETTCWETMATACLLRQDFFGLPWKKLADAQLYSPTQEEVQESEAPTDEDLISPSAPAKDAVVAAPGLTGLTHTPQNPVHSKDKNMHSLRCSSQALVTNMVFSYQSVHTAASV